MATFADAQKAKGHAKGILTTSRYPEISGLGIAPARNGWVLKVNLRHAAKHRLPRTVKGVPVISEVVGEVVAANHAAVEKRRRRA